jgi:cell division GTPase FtsZ
VTILLLSSGGGGGNILRSLKALFLRDLAVTQRSDARYAERLRRAVTTRFLDTNEFSLAAAPKEERLVIGAATTRGLGSMHDPDVAARALEESQNEIESLLSRHSVIVIIGTGGKGTGAGTVLPIAQMARRQKKLVIPVFIRPSFERHEVEKRRYDHALRVADGFDAAGIRLMEILNDRGYADDDPQPQSVVWERMNLPIARGLRGLLYVLWDLSQVDPSDLSMLFGGAGRLRIGFSELNPAAGQEPSDDDIKAAVRSCWENPYCSFTRAPGTSLVCIQGDWSNVTDGKIKGSLASLALSGSADSPYNPLYARATSVPRPWGITTLFSEYTGTHPPLEIDWTTEKKAQLRFALQSDAVLERPAVSPRSDAPEPVPVAAAPPVVAVTADTAAVPTLPAFASVWDFARAVNRSDPAALKLAGNGADPEVPIDAGELRKLVGTFWFRSVFPRLSAAWRRRMLDVLLEHVSIPDHVIRTGRRSVHLSELTHEQRRQLVIGVALPDEVRADLQLLVTVARFWGEEAANGFELRPVPDAAGPSGLASLLQPFRHS